MDLISKLMTISTNQLARISSEQTFISRSLNYTPLAISLSESGLNKSN